MFLVCLKGEQGWVKGVADCCFVFYCVFSTSFFSLFFPSSVFISFICSEHRLDQCTAIVMHD